MTARQEIERFDLSLSIEEAPTPPSSWYLDPTVLELELNTLFRRHWQPVGRLDQVGQPGDFFSGEFAGQPFVVTRAPSGQLHAFYNVCRHHAALVAQGEGCASELVCPYHGWTYDLDGRLRKAPRLGAVKCFQREEYGLKPIALQVWGPLIFLCFGEPASDLEQDLAPFARLVPPESLGRLKFVARKSYQLECNWKVYVDNYLDGGYHVEVAHKGLASQLDLDAYRTEVLPNLVLQTCGAGSGGAEGGLDFAERLEGGAVYAWLHPNFMINRYGTMMDTNWVVPLGPDRCLTIFDYYFENADDQEFVERSLAASHQVQLEDVEICESVQRGLRSAGYDVGRYAPGLEMGEYAFHRWLREELLS